MNKIVEVEGADGLYEVKKLKVLWQLGYSERLVYKINLDTKEFTYKEIK